MLVHSIPRDMTVLLLMAPAVLLLTAHTCASFLVSSSSRRTRNCQVFLFGKHATDDRTSKGLHHQFWGQERSEMEVLDHIMGSLSQIEDAATNESVSVLSAEPPLVHIRDFLSSSMCEEIIEAALLTGDMKRSTTGEEQKASSSRTSSTTWLRENQCEVPLRMLAEKVSRISGLPTENLENLQVCRYLPGQEFKLHTDNQDSFNNLEVGGRLATCLVYLEEPTEGGETWFPGIASASSDIEGSEGTVLPVERGSAVFFWNTVEKPGIDGYDPEMFLNTDHRLRHAGMPVLEGCKWICNRWIHPVNFGAGIRGND